MTPIDTTAVNATVTPSLLPLRAGRVRIRANAATASTALKGMRRSLTRLQIRQPGTAPSRLKAYIMRDALVMHAMPQKTWPIAAMMMTALAQPVLMADSKTAIDVPPASLMAFSSAAAKVIASSTMYPMTAE